MREYIMPLSVGLTIFLFGIQLIRMGLQPLAESKLQQWLQKTTKTPYHGILTGAFATMAVQSSSAVTVMTIECIHIGLFTFFQSVGIIIGANVGTTFTAQIMAWNVEAYAPYLLVCGALLWLLPSTKYRCLGWRFPVFPAFFSGCPQ